MPIEILMPALSPTMTEGTLAKWNKKEGEAVKSGEVIAEIETDKATMEVEAVDEGTLGKILVKEGAQGVPVNQVIALLLEEGEDRKVLEGYKAEISRDFKKDNKEIKAPKPTLAPKFSPTPALTPVLTQYPAPRTQDRIKASPLARRAAAQAGIELTQIAGTGPHGRIIRVDVEEALKGGGSSVGVIRRNSQEFLQVPHSTMRRTIARRLTESKQTIPHFYLTIDCRIDDLLAVRKQLNDHAAMKAGKAAEPAYKISVNDMVIKAAALAMHDIPTVNVSWYDDALVQYNNVDISVAVATPGGLITPIIRNADQKTLPQISAEMKELAARARNTQLKLYEYEGGGFSISNLGMYGIKHFEAIINPPQACILAVGAGEQRAVIKDGEVYAATLMHATLSVDHRAVDGALGAKWLQAFKGYLEKPILLVM